jgi:hypothetical protein
MAIGIGSSPRRRTLTWDGRCRFHDICTSAATDDAARTGQSAPATITRYRGPERMPSRSQSHTNGAVAAQSPGHVTAGPGETPGPAVSGADYPCRCVDSVWLLFPVTGSTGELALTVDFVVSAMPLAPV